MNAGGHIYYFGVCPPADKKENLYMKTYGNTGIICSENSWIEGDAVRQLRQVSELDGIVESVGLPDIHPGKYGPVGAAFLSRGIIYPTLIGGDAGCGIGVFATDVKKKKIKKDKWVRRLKGLDRPFDEDLDAFRSSFNIDAGLDSGALGTIGGGNHFAELQSFDTVYDGAALAEFGLDKDYLLTLVHSGSRSIGEVLLRRHTDRYGAKGLDAESSEAECYMVAHDDALRWAACNRAVIAKRFGMSIGAECTPALDICHNSVARKSFDDRTLWLHRKGAANAETGLVVVPGSRGSLSYLVKPKGDQRKNLWSLPHGAGRKWKRGGCKERLRDRFSAKSLIQTPMGSHVICDDRDLLYEEAPQAYKNIDAVIEDLKSADLVDVAATMKPIITYKMRKE
jgi:release factor H-coupled RctB family protein